MSNLQINIQASEDISWILDAAQETMCATEKDFEAIQSKKWYKRLWETVTFSKDNQIHLAKGVSSLTKLQEIMVRLLVVLSQDNLEISNAIKQNSDLISRLSNTDMLLSKEIDRIKYGGTANISFSDVDPENKTIIANMLVRADSNANATDYSRQYLSSIMGCAGILEVDYTLNIAVIDSLTREEQELLYRMIMINRHLMVVDFDAVSDVVDSIPISTKRAKEICSAIESTASYVSPEFFATYYEKTCGLYDEISEDDIWFEDFGQIGEAENESVVPGEYEDLIISDFWHIAKGEVCRFSYKYIHVQSIVDCEGTLEFENCTIHYGENEHFSEIKVNENGSISMRNCTVMGYSYFKDKHFITVGASNGTTTFTGCTFVDCASFIHIRNSLELKDCVVRNPGSGFIYARSYSHSLITGNDPSTSVIENSRFAFENPPDFIKKSSGVIIQANNLIFSESKVVGEIRISSEEDANEKADSFSTFVLANKVKADRVLFVGISDIFKCTGEIKHSDFRECRGIVGGFAPFSDKLTVEDCTFEQCTTVGNCISNVNFSHCKFIYCYNCLISSGGEGKVHLEYCTFNKWCAIKEDKSRYFSSAMLEFERYKGKNYNGSSVKNCIFDNITANQYFVVLGRAHENLDGYVASVEQCIFTNCTTERDSGKIIREYDHYYGLFNKRKNIRTVKVYSDCQGLDQVKKFISPKSK